MWIEKPSWISHGPKQDVPILTLDVQPQMERIVTGAMDCTIRVWNFRGIQDPGEKDLKLAEISNHCGPVNCVRWNPDTLTFASASDDKLVIVWEQKEWGLSDNLEDWKTNLTLIGHASDVKDLSWSKTGRLLASASIDNSVIVWNIAARESRPFQVLKGHESFVTSVAFHPYDKYLVSLGEDKKLIVWDAAGWTEVKSLRPLISHNSSQVMKRICFTPDAKNLAIPGPKQASFRYTGGLLNGNTFESDRYLSGHLQPVSVVSASPVLYKSSKPNDNTLAWAIALGGFDSAISIWKENELKPIVVRDLFDSAISDISWSSDGKFLLVCSSDSSIAAIYIANELGDTANLQEMHSYMFTIYSDFPPEPVIQHTLKRTTKQKTEPQPMNEQKEIRLKNGKKRIQPVLLSTLQQGPLNVNIQQFKQSTAQNLRIISSSSAPSLPQLEIPSLSKRYWFSKMICNSEMSDFTEHKTSLNLLHVSQLVKGSGDIYIEALNCEFENVNSVIQLKKGNKMIWENFLCHKACLLAGSGYFAAVYTEEGYLYCFSIGGLQCLPEMKIENVKMMEGCGYFLLLACRCSQKNNTILLYDLQKQEESVRSELNNVEIKKLSVSSSGVPKIETKSGEHFNYDLAIRAWVKVKYSGLETFEAKGWKPETLLPKLDLQELDSFEKLEISEVQNQLRRLSYFGYKEEYFFTAKKYVGLLLDSGDRVKVWEFLGLLKKQTDVKGNEKKVEKNEGWSEGLYEEICKVVELNDRKLNVLV